MYIQTVIKPNTLLPNGIYGIVKGESGCVILC